MDYPFPAIVLDTLDRWNAERQVCPQCGGKLSSLTLDTIGAEGEKYLMFHAQCDKECGAFIYIVSKEDERIYFEGPNALTSRQLSDIYSHAVSAMVGVADIQSGTDIKLGVFNDLIEFFEDWKDKMQAKIAMLEEIEAYHARATIDWKYMEHQAEHIGMCMIYNHASIVNMLPEELRKRVDSEDVLEISHTPEKHLIQFHYRPKQEVTQ
jgi:hypothetical protein